MEAEGAARGRRAGRIALALASAAVAAGIGLAGFALGKGEDPDPPVGQRQSGEARQLATIHHLREGRAPATLMRIPEVGSLSASCSGGTVGVGFRADRLLPTATLVMREVGGPASLVRKIQPGDSRVIRASLRGGGTALVVSVIPFSKARSRLTTASVAVARAAGAPYYACDVGVRAEVAPLAFP